MATGPRRPNWKTRSRALAQSTQPAAWPARVSGQRPIVGGHEGRYPWPRPRTCAAWLPTARPDIIHLLRRAQPPGRPAALSEQFWRQGSGCHPLLVRHPRQPAPRDGGPEEALRRQERSARTNWPRCSRSCPVVRRSSTASTSSPRTATCQTIARCGSSFWHPNISTPARNRVWPSMLCWITSAITAQSPDIGATGSSSLHPTTASLARLRDCIRVALAWGSIVEDVNARRLNIDQLQKKQAEKELQGRGRCSAACRPRVLQMAPMPRRSTRPPNQSQRLRRFR